MTIFIDKNRKIVDLQLKNWDGDNWSPDWSRDFWDVGELVNVNDDTDVFPDDGPYATLLKLNGYSASEPVYEVEEVDYLVDYANDMIQGIGDFDTPSPDTTLFVDRLEPNHD